MGGNICCEPRNYGVWNDSSGKNMVFLPRPVRSDYDQIFDQARLLLTELELLRSEFSDARKRMLELASAEESAVIFSVNNAIKCFIWGVSASKQGVITTLDIHIDSNRAPYLFIKLDDAVHFPKEMYQFEKALNSYFRILFTYQGRIDGIISEIQPLEIRLDAMIKCELADNKVILDYNNKSEEIVNTAEDNLSQMRTSIMEAKAFRSKIFSEKGAFENNLEKLKEALQKCERIGFEAHSKKLLTPKEIAGSYITK